MFPPSRPLWASNHPCSRQLKVSILCLQFNSTSDGVGVPGRPRGLPFSEQRTGTNAWRTATGPVWLVRRLGRGLQYLVDWEGYGLEERSWILRAALLDKDMLREFNAAHPGKPGGRRGAPVWGGGYCHGQGSAGR